MITPGQVEEWISEIQERPESAGTIIRALTERLGELSESNEQLLVENISLRSGEKVEEYERRIEKLAYQLELLKRQLGGLPLEQEAPEGLSLLVYAASGRILRFPFDPAALVSGETIARISAESLGIGDVPQIMVIDSKEELLCVFDSGRSMTVPVAELSPVDGDILGWEQATLQEPRGGEVLVAILGIARMALSDFCVQVSRRGYVKKIRETFMESYIASGNIGTGVLAPQDKTYGLALCAEDDLLVLVSKEGAATGLPVARLPYSIHEAFRLNPADHVIRAFVSAGRPSFLAITQNGLVFHREADWLALGDNDKPKNRAILSKARRKSGMRIVGAATVDTEDWIALLTSDGRITVYSADELLRAGSVLVRESALEVLSFGTF